MKLVPVKEAVGMVLAHDMTEIIPGVSKKAAFKKGHIVKESDIERLLNMGKAHIGILEISENDIHENEAAIMMAKAACKEHIDLSDPSEGKVSMYASCDGLLKVDEVTLEKVNHIQDIMMATLHNNRPIKKGMLLGGTRIIPLITNRDHIDQMVSLCEKPIIRVLPYEPLPVGIVTTGSEVYSGRIQDRFGPVIKEKVAEYHCDVVGQIIVDDHEEDIKNAIETLISKGAKMIACTGGMSVDPDDVTPLGIRNTGANIVAYGAPVLPGAMFMLAYLREIPIVGLPGCVMYARRTIFDLVLPRLLAKEQLTKSDIASLGHGGLCLNCDTCTYPNCGFGK